MAAKDASSFKLEIEQGAEIFFPSIAEMGDARLSPFCGCDYHRHQAWKYADRIYKFDDPVSASAREVGLFLYHLERSSFSMNDILPVEADRGRIQRAVACYEAEGCLALARLRVRKRLFDRDGLVAEDIKLMYEHLSSAGLKPEDIGTDFTEIKRLLNAEKSARVRRLLLETLPKTCVDE